MIVMVVAVPCWLLAAASFLFIVSFVFCYKFFCLKTFSSCFKVFSMFLPIILNRLHMYLLCTTQILFASVVIVCCKRNKKKILRTHFSLLPLCSSSIASTRTEWMWCFFLAFIVVAFLSESFRYYSAFHFSASLSLYPYLPLYLNLYSLFQFLLFPFDVWSFFLFIVFVVVFCVFFFVSVANAVAIHRAFVVCSPLFRCIIFVAHWFLPCARIILFSFCSKSFVGCFFSVVIFYLYQVFVAPFCIELFDSNFLFQCV